MKPDSRNYSYLRYLPLILRIGKMIKKLIFFSLIINFIDESRL